MALAGLASGCLGSLGDADPGDGWLDKLFDDAVNGGDGDGDGDGDDPNAEILVAPELAFPRLSHVQWENTVQTLLGLDAPTGMSDSFYPDPSASSTFDNNRDSQSVNADLWADYQRAAEEIGALVASDTAVLATVVDGASDAETFIRSFGKRAYRRPLTDAEVATYRAHFDRAPELDAPAADAFTAGVRLVVETMLQSPYFVYHVEVGGEPDAEGLRKLDGWEVASKLSYTLWNDMPDAELFDAAEAGQLDDAERVGVAIDRLLGSPRAKANMSSFIDQIFTAEQFESINKSEESFPGWDDGTSADLREELARFTEKVFFDDDGGLEELLLSRTTFVNARVAAIYGLEGDFSDDAWTEVTLPGERAGLLTLAGFLAWKGTTYGTPDSIMRGVFVARNILCADLPDPPDEAAGQTPDEGTTNRSKIDNLTGNGTCGEGCHSAFINPLGFGLEHFDGFGRYQTEDAGEPIDASGEFRFVNGMVAFDGAVELSEAIATSEDAHRCFAKRWIEFEHGRALVDEDEGLIDAVTDLSRDGASVREIVRAVLTSKAFLAKKAVDQ